MSTRMRSPSYPSTPLGEAIELIRKIHKTERTNSVDRDVAVQAMGYSGISGASAKILSNLTQYGLLERAGKNEVRVSRRAVEILHPESDASKNQALRDAAFEPELFQRIRERFPNGQPSEAALRSYFVREEFTDAAIPSAVKAYIETCQFLEDLNVSESHSVEFDVEGGSQDPQRIRQGDDMRSLAHARQTVPYQQDSQTLTAPHSGTGGPKFTFDNNKFWLGGVIATRQEAEMLVAYLNAVKGFLPDEQAEKSAVEPTDVGGKKPSIFDVDDI